MKHVASLRLSLLVSLGLIPVACGGTALRGNDDDQNTSGSGTGGSSSGAGQGGKKPTAAGTTGKGGAPNVAGTTSSGGAVVVSGGATSTGGNVVVGGAGPSQPCTAPKLDPATGLVNCNEGYQHRPSAKRCELSDPGGYAGEGGGGANGADPLPRAPNDSFVSCTPNQAGECSQYHLGYCAFVGQGAACRSGCSTDSECGNGYICRCGGASPTGGECIPSDCKTDADCGANSYCASYNGLCGDGGFACLRATDECLGTQECASSCTWSPDRGRYCNDAVCGRPFLVEAETRVAPVVDGAEWSALGTATPRVDHLTFAERQLLTEHWTRMGQMEHASIAAFARFSLQLLALGAPPELVEACTSALADETAHTRLCFRIASAYAGHHIGPGALDVSGNLLPTSLVDIVELVIAEGCFGETSAALEALQAAETASDPVIAAAYGRIASDEQRHAELAFRFVRWALERAPSDVAGCISRAIAGAASQDPGVDEVARPCLQALLDRADTVPSREACAA
jgi:hypothetical protein